MKLAYFTLIISISAIPVWNFNFLRGTASHGGEDLTAALTQSFTDISAANIATTRTRTRPRRNWLRSGNNVEQGPDDLSIIAVDARNELANIPGFTPKRKWNWLRSRKARNTDQLSTRAQDPRRFQTLDEISDHSGRTIDLPMPRNLERNADQASTNTLDPRRFENLDHNSDHSASKIDDLSTAPRDPRRPQITRQRSDHSASTVDLRRPRTPNSNRNTNQVPARARDSTSRLLNQELSQEFNDMVRISTRFGEIDHPTKFQIEKMSEIMDLRSSGLGNMDLQKVKRIRSVQSVLAKSLGLDLRN
jgi:hypothetical protein